jgi:hypothetical protein
VVAANCSATANSGAVKAQVFLNETTKGYAFSTDLYCRDNNFSFASTIYPGLYSIAVRGGSLSYDNLPTQSFLAVTRIQLP